MLAALAAAVVAQVPVPSVAEAALPQVPVLALVEAAELDVGFGPVGQRFARATEAVDLVRAKLDADGRLPLENPIESELVGARIRDLGFDMHEREGQPSRWNTLRGLRVLRWSATIG